MGEAGIIVKGDDQFDQLMAIWLQERRPGTVVLPGGKSFRVFPLNDDDVRFKPIGTGIEEAYESRSTKKLGK